LLCTHIPCAAFLDDWMQDTTPWFHPNALWGPRFPCLPETRWSRSTDRVGHSVDGGVFQALCGFVLSMCYSIDTTRGHACDRRRIPQLFCGHWLRSGIATPPQRPWQCRSFNGRSCWYTRAYTRRGVYMQDTTVHAMKSVHMY